MRAGVEKLTWYTGTPHFASMRASRRNPWRLAILMGLSVQALIQDSVARIAMLRIMTKEFGIGVLVLSFLIIALWDRAITYIITIERGDKEGVETC